MRETLDGFQLGGQMITNLRCADNIILLATSEVDLQELVVVGGWPRLCQPQIHPTHQCRQDQGNGERRHHCRDKHNLCNLS